MPTIKDPLGRLIDLSDTTWFGHIIKGHPEMRGLNAEACATLSIPTAILHTTSDRDCRLYYGPSPQPGLIICIVADVARRFVKTAYLARKIKQGIQEWP